MRGIKNRHLWTMSGIMVMTSVTLLLTMNPAPAQAQQIPVVEAPETTKIMNIPVSAAIANIVLDPEVSIQMVPPVIIFREDSSLLLPEEVVATGIDTYAKLRIFNREMIPSGSELREVKELIDIHKAVDVKAAEMEKARIAAQKKRALKAKKAKAVKKAAVSATVASHSYSGGSSAVKTAIRKAAADSNVSGSIGLLMWLCNKESTFRPNALSASGSYHGLFQLSAGMAHGHPWQDPYWNTMRAIRYMKGRYGSVSAACAHSRAHNWY